MQRRLSAGSVLGIRIETEPGDDETVVNFLAAEPLQTHFLARREKEAHGAGLKASQCAIVAPISHKETAAIDDARMKTDDDRGGREVHKGETGPRP